MRRFVLWSAAVLAFSTSLIGARARAQQVDFQFNVYSDVNFSVSSEEGAHPEFFLGGVDFFFNSNLSEHFSASAEAVLENLGEDTVFDLERLFVRYKLHPAFGLRMGRVHSPMGYYFGHYHHGKLFQATFDRPEMVNWEDDGGILPAHLIGLEASGEVGPDRVKLIYALAAGNGRGQFADDVLSAFDRNDFKASLAKVGIRFPTLDLETGASAYYDVIPEGYADETGTVLITERIEEAIVGGHLAYTHYPATVLVEYYTVRHTGLSSDTVWNLKGGFAQVSYDIKGFEPFARIEIIRRNEFDPFFVVSGVDREATEYHAGVKITLHEKVALKIDIEHEDAVSVEGEDEHKEVGVLQIAFGL